MIVVRVELHSAVTRQITELARMHICNIGGNASHGNYAGKTFKGRSADALDRMNVGRTGEVTSHLRLRVHVWAAEAVFGPAGKSVPDKAQETLL